MSPEGVPTPPSETTAQLWAAFGADLRRSLARRAGPRLDPDELLQETFLRAHRSIDRLRDEERAGPWLGRIARSVLVDELRRVRELPEPELANERGALVAGDEGAGEDVEREVARALLRFLPALGEQDQELIREADLEGLPRRELAARHGLGLSALKSRLARARERLARALDACCRVELDRRGGVAGLVRRGTPEPGGCAGADGPRASGCDEDDQPPSCS